ncbi:hypothetical protein R6V09_30770 [Streptomyces sp. W16]|uniref:hypothetical protein n=1 Tax=Streptomyces sp. W16 TaxID=3076631 RepID=UPI00295B2B06|nr:hypothetical protein [Streptomyces sp. W16]MDV9174478.1 hypothetical protein [Streptomyces sp. W16]
MIEQDLGSGVPPDSVEQRLRDALRARADSVDLSALRPAVPPTARARFRLTVVRPVRRTALALLVVAAAVVGVLFAATYLDQKAPVRPAGVPSVSPSSGDMTATPYPPGSNSVTAVPHP